MEDFLVVVGRQVKVVIVAIQFALQRNAIIRGCIVYLTLYSYFYHFPAHSPPPANTGTNRTGSSRSIIGTISHPHLTTHFRHHAINRPVTAVRHGNHALAPLRHHLQHLANALVLSATHTTSLTLRVREQMHQQRNVVLGYQPLANLRDPVRQLRERLPLQLVVYAKNGGPHPPSCSSASDTAVFQPVSRPMRAASFREWL